MSYISTDSFEIGNKTCIFMSEFVRHGEISSKYISPKVAKTNCFRTCQFQVKRKNRLVFRPKAFESYSSSVFQLLREDSHLVRGHEQKLNLTAYKGQVKFLNTPFKYHLSAEIFVDFCLPSLSTDTLG